MRLRILDSGYSFGTKALFATIRSISRQPVLDMVKLVKYRPGFYGRPISAVNQEAELMAALVAKTNQCEFCAKAHAAVAETSILGRGKGPCIVVRARRSHY